LRDRLRDIEQHLVAFLRVITSRAQTEIDVLMPGYIHLQRAQPIRWSHRLLSYGTFLSTDLERLRQVIKRVNKPPLRAGAIVGHPFGIGRETMAEELGFEGIINNSMAAVVDRDSVVETLQWAATAMLHIFRWAEDLVLYSTAEFGFVRPVDAYSTGSTLMLQRRIRIQLSYCAAIVDECSVRWQV
jgi:argininosuccinate lyase